MEVEPQLLMNVGRELFAAHEGLAHEAGLMFELMQRDPAMSLVRARRLLEIMLVQRWFKLRNLTPPAEKAQKTLYAFIEELMSSGDLPWSLGALCHRVRLEGNRAVHYWPASPEDPASVKVSPGTLTGVLRSVLEIREVLERGEHSVYLASLPEQFASMYRVFQRQWAGQLRAKYEGKFALFDALDLFFRSAVAGMEPSGMDLLKRYSEDPSLARVLSKSDEAELRRLRNLSLIQHDGEWLFTPSRSKNIWPSAAGRFLLALADQGTTTVNELEAIARDVVRKLSDVATDADAVALLSKIQKAAAITLADKQVARRLRNLLLVQHEEELLVQAHALSLTDLGYYVLGIMDKRD